MYKKWLILLIILMSLNISYASTSLDYLTKPRADILYCHSDGSNCANQTVNIYNTSVSHLNNLSDVDVSSPTDNSFLYWNATLSAWKAKVISLFSGLFSDLDFSGTTGFSDLVDNDTTYTNQSPITLTGNEFGLMDCADEEILKYNTTSGRWECKPDTGTAQETTQSSYNGTLMLISDSQTEGVLWNINKTQAEGYAFKVYPDTIIRPIGGEIV